MSVICEICKQPCINNVNNLSCCGIQHVVQQMLHSKSNSWHSWHTFNESDCLFTIYDINSNNIKIYKEYFNDITTCDVDNLTIKDLNELLLYHDSNLNNFHLVYIFGDSIVNMEDEMINFESKDYYLTVLVEQREEIKDIYKINYCDSCEPDITSIIQSYDNVMLTEYESTKNIFSTAYLTSIMVKNRHDILSYICIYNPVSYNPVLVYSTSYKFNTKYADIQKNCLPPVFLCRPLQLLRDKRKEKSYDDEDDEDEEDEESELDEDEYYNNTNVFHCNLSNVGYVVELNTRKYVTIKDVIENFDGNCVDDPHHCFLESIFCYPNTIGVNGQIYGKVILEFGS